MDKVILSDKSEIEIRKPKLRDIKAINNIKDALEKESTLLSNLTGKTMEELDDMLFSDYSLLSMEINSFLLSTGSVQKEE